MIHRISPSLPGGEVTQTWCNFRGGTRAFDSAELFAVTAKKITCLGSNDRTDPWLRGVPTDEGQRESHSSIALQAGDSDPPIP